MTQPDSPSLADTAAYIAATCADLRRISTDPALRTINYLLDMARVEAARLADAERRRPRGCRSPRR